jgi:hypothetical protein
MSMGIDFLRTCGYLYLHSLNESSEGSLRIVVHEAKVGESPEPEALARETSPEVRKLLSESRGIVHDKSCRVFELTWSSYIGYSVENESYAVVEPKSSIGEGRLVIVYTTSVYLDYLSKATFASAEYPAPFKHWAICCLDQIVNVASTQEPAIEVRSAA